MSFIEQLEQKIGKKAIKEFLPMQKGDVYKTWANTNNLNAALGYKPSISMEIGVKKFVDWFMIYFRKTVESYN
jgi:UDP-glucuronate 4-epimerase